MLTVSKTGPLMKRSKLAKGLVPPVAVAVTVKLPVVPLAVNVGAVAIPLAFVSTVALAPKAPLAPLPGAANVTLTFDTGWPAAFLTMTARFVAKAELI